MRRLASWKPVFAVAGDVDHEAVLLQPLAQVAGGFLFVFDDEQFHVTHHSAVGVVSGDIIVSCIAEAMTNGVVKRLRTLICDRLATTPPDSSYFAGGSSVRVAGGVGLIA